MQTNVKNTDDGEQIFHQLNKNKINQYQEKLLQEN